MTSSSMVQEMLTPGPDEAEIVSTLVMSLRQEPLAYFRRALITAGVLEELKLLLSVRDGEKKYENGVLGWSSIHFSTQPVTHCHTRCE